MLELSDFLESKGIEEADTAEYSLYVLYCMPLSCCVHLLCVQCALFRKCDVHYLERFHRGDIIAC